MEKLSKAEAKYTDKSSDPEHHSCGICEHFEPPRGCEVVKGKVRAEGGCEVLFHLDAVRWMEK